MNQANQVTQNNDQSEIILLKSKIDELERKISNLTLDFFLDDFEVVDTVPTGKPVNFKNRKKIYKSGTDRRIYYYDYKNGEWCYLTATAV